MVESHNDAPPQSAPSTVATDPHRARRRATATGEALFVALLVIGLGMLIYWRDLKAKEALEESETHLKGIIALRSQTLDALEEQTNQLARQLIAISRDTLPKSFADVREILNAAREISTTALSESRAAAASAQAALTRGTESDRRTSFELPLDPPRTGPSPVPSNTFGSEGSSIPVWRTTKSGLPYMELPEYEGSNPQFREIIRSANQTTRMILESDQ